MKVRDRVRLVRDVHNAALTKGQEGVIHKVNPIASREAIQLGHPSYDVEMPDGFRWMILEYEIEQIEVIPL